MPAVHHMDMPRVEPPWKWTPAADPAGTRSHVLRQHQAVAGDRKLPGPTIATGARWQNRAGWADRGNGGPLQHDRAEYDRLATGGYFRASAADGPDDSGAPVWHQHARVPMGKEGQKGAENYAANFQHSSDNGPGPGGYAPFEDCFEPAHKVAASCKVCGKSGHWGFECTLGDAPDASAQPRLRGLPPRPAQSAEREGGGGTGGGEGREEKENLNPKS
ncbi:hypothetical protein T484DRAFT_2021217 [Baffinella frigidus]|nr:hypothetical protein T484DRAFT_2021217 [Cryptophyta sp. CCMP2293]